MSTLQDSKKKYSVPALDKAMAILEMIATSDEEHTVTEIQTELSLPKATVFMILSVLEEYNMVRKDINGRFSLGSKIYTLGMAYLTKLDIREISRPYIEQLARDTGLTSHLGILTEHRILFIDKVEQQSFIKFSTFPGMRSDIHNSSLGKAIAAHLPESEVDFILQTNGMGRYTPNTIIEPEKFHKVLGLIRQVGYAIEDEEGEIGVRCIGAPIFNHDGKVVAAVSITALKADLIIDLFPIIGEKVKRIANTISKELGFDRHHVDIE